MPEGPVEIETPTPVVVEIQNYQELLDQGFDWGKDRKIGGGTSGTAYKLNWQTPEGKTIPAVLKFFDGRTGHNDFPGEKSALIELQGVPGVVRLIAYGEPKDLHHPILIKEYVEGENMSQNSAIFPAKQQPEINTNVDLAQKAKWFLSFLETMDEIHKRDLLLGDFKYDDVLWDPATNRAVLIDFGNAVKRTVKDTSLLGNRSTLHDCLHVVNLLVTDTEIARNLRMRIASSGSLILGMNTIEVKIMELFKKECQNQSAVPELLRIIERYQNMNDSDEKGKGLVNIPALIGEIKDYFWAIGLRVENEDIYWRRKDTVFIQKLEQAFSDPSLAINPADLLRVPGRQLIYEALPDEDKSFFFDKRYDFLDQLRQKQLQEEYGVGYPGIRAELGKANRYFATPRGQSQQKELLADIPVKELMNRFKSTTFDLSDDPKYGNLIQDWRNCQLALSRLKVYHQYGSNIPGNPEEFKDAEGQLKKRQDDAITHFRQLWDKERQEFAKELKRLEQNFPYPHRYQQLIDALSRSRMATYPDSKKNLADIRKSCRNKYQQIPLIEEAGFPFKKPKIPQVELDDVEAYLASSEGQQLQKEWAGQFRIETTDNRLKDFLTAEILYSRLVEYYNNVPADNQKAINEAFQQSDNPKFEDPQLIRLVRIRKLLEEQAAKVNEIRAKIQKDQR